MKQMMPINEECTKEHRVIVVVQTTVLVAEVVEVRTVEVVAVAGS